MPMTIKVYLLGYLTDTNCSALLQCRFTQSFSSSQVLLPGGQFPLCWPTFFWRWYLQHFTI